MKLYLKNLEMLYNDSLCNCIFTSKNNNALM